MEDIIITVLALAVGLGFKLVEKKLKSAGKPAKTGRLKEFAEIFSYEDTEVFPPVSPPEVNEQPQQEPVPEPVVIESVVAAPAPVEEAPRSVKPVEVSVLQEEDPEQKEKIDPKKLIVYSEIMKPKYLE